MDEGRGWWARLEAWWSPPARNALYVLAVTALLVFGAYGEAHPSDPQFPPGQHVPYTPTAAYLLVVAACLPLAVRRRRPVAALIASIAAVTAYTLLGYVNGAALVAPMLALYALACASSARRALAWSVGTLVLLMTVTAIGNPVSPFWGAFYIMPFVVGVACFAGIAVGNRRAYVASIHARAEADTRRQVDEERLRIARELHDVVAHTMATITVQASAASQLLRDQPEQAAESLAAIRAASKDGLRELRSILDVLRTLGDGPAGPGGSGAAPRERPAGAHAMRHDLMVSRDPRQPVPGLARLDTLAERVRQAGLPVTVTVTGEPLPLPAVVDLSAFRIIQEALTNTIRHAGPATAAVTVRYGRDDLRIEIVDTGTGGTIRSAKPDKSPAADGHGLRGMRERAAAAGGTIEIGPLEPSGFRVAACFPVSIAEIVMGEALR